METEQTGEQLFLRYSFPCAAGRNLCGHIDEEHLIRLERFALEGGQPKRQLLRYCFPHAYRRHREFAQSIGIIGEDRWSIEVVRSFWRHHHGHTGECRIKRGQVVSFENDIVLSAVFQGEKIKVLNLYRLSLDIGDTVYTHLRVVVEKD